MVISKNINNITQLDRSALTMGSFDGMHVGHMEVINTVKSVAKKKDIPTAVITFDPHPKTVINNNGQEKWFNITSTNKKLEILEQNGIDYVWLVPFDNDFANITAQYFMDNYIIEYFKPEDIIIGYDHHFGNKREGDAEFLSKHSEKYNYKLHVIEPSKINNISISSTQIRQFIEKCNVESANNFLGWNYELSGQVVKGSGVGNKIKFPTANVNPGNKNQLIPGKGAYCVDVLVDNQKYLGMCNIGVRPTLYEKGEIVIEVHLITENALSLLNKNIKLNFKSFIRKEKKYENTNELVKQLELDRQLCISN
jgi:riboflavin kinase/FMN adenylyltransferase